MENVDEVMWQNAWAAEKTPWDTGKSAPALLYALQNFAPHDGRARGGEQAEGAMGPMSEATATSIPAASARTASSSTTNMARPASDASQPQGHQAASVGSASEASAAVDARLGPNLSRGRVLVPGCGRGYDVFTFAEAGFDALGVDIAPAAAPHFEAQGRASLAASRYGQATLHVGDFFALPEDPGFDIVWDYTFLCALPPAHRPAWAQKTAALLAPDGQLWSLLFPVDPHKDPTQGPPFALDPDVIHGLLEAQGLQRRALMPAPQSIPSRQGKEFLGLWQKASTAR